MKLDDRGIKDFFTFIGVMGEDGVIRGKVFSSPSACGSPAGGSNPQVWLKDYAATYSTERAINDCLLSIQRSRVSSGTFDEIIRACTAREGALVIYRGEGHWELYRRNVLVAEV